MLSWTTIPEQTIKPIVSFLLNRYVGELLLTKVSRDQLTIDLGNSTGSLNDVNLNVQYINDALNKADVPLELIDGYVNSIVVQVPFMKVLEDSCTIEVTGLEITVQPRPHAAGDLVTSMFESMVGSMTTSMDLARSFVEEQGGLQLDSDDQQVKGIDALARLIEIVLSRMKVIFHDTVIRVEHFPAGQDSLGIALEINIQRLEFLDELLVDVEAQKGSDPITSQPHSIGVPSSSDVCKIIRLQGVRLSTDVFSKPIDMLCKSVYLRSSRKICETSMSSSAELNRPDQAASIYQSIHSSMATPTSSSVPSTAYIASKPLQFAQFSSEKIFVKIKLKNSSTAAQPLANVSPKTENVDVDMFLGALNIFLTPTQVHLLIALATAMMPDPNANADSTEQKEKPMQADDFAKVEWDLKQNIDEGRLGSRVHVAGSNALQSDFQLGNWSGEDAFYSTSRFPKTLLDSRDVTESTIEFTSIAITDVPGPDLLETVHWKQNSGFSNVNNNNARIKFVHTEKPETTRCKMSFSSLWMTLTHEDLSSTSTGGSAAAVDTLSGLIATFFQVANRLPLAAGTVLKDVRKRCDCAYEKDHLRFIGCPFILEYTSQRNSASKSSSSTRAPDLMQFQISSGNCELLEFLCERSNWNSTGENTGSDPIRVELLSFDRDSGDAAEMPDFSLKLTREALRYTCNVSLRPCRTEFDVSLADRLCNLFSCQPNFKRACVQQQQQFKRQKYLFDVPPVNDLTLRDDLFEPLEQKSTDFEMTFELSCLSWMLDLRFPVPDMRSVQAVDRRPWWVRDVRREILRLQFDHVKLCTLFNESLAKQGRFVIEFRKGTGFFKMCSGDEFVKFLHANTPSTRGGTAKKICSIEIKWDLVARSLLDERHDGAAVSGHSSSAENSLEKDCFNINSQLDGPFSKRSVAHENEQLTIVGSKEEISEFRRVCLRRCEMGVAISVPELRLYLPSKEFFTILYNRIANDVVLWSPSGPGFQCHSNDIRSNTAFSVHVTGLGLDDDLFGPCKSMHKFDGSISESEISNGDRTLNMGGNGRYEKNREAHKFTFLLQCERLDVVAAMPVEGEPDSSGLLKLSAEFSELFVVSGFDGDENTVYFYLTTKALALWHDVINSTSIRTVSEQSSFFDVESEFGQDAENFSLPCVAEPTPLRLALKNESGDNFTVALRSCLDPKRNIKDFLVTIGFRNSTIHYRMQPSNHYWLMQLIDFFDLTDDQILGFDPPKTVTELHVHGWCMSAEYKPPLLPYIIRYYVDSLDISSNLVQEAAMFRLHFIFEESSLFLNAAGSSVDLPLSAFVCLMRMGFFELIVSSTEPQPHETSRRPLLEVQARNDLLELRTCADSLAALASIAQYLGNEGAAASTSASPVDQVASDGLGEMASGPIINGILEEQSKKDASSEDKLRDMMASAMEDAILPPIRTMNAGAANNAGSRCAVGGVSCGKVANRNADITKVKPPEPIIRILNPEPVRVAENHFKPPLRRTDLFASLPPGYPTPLVQYSFRDISLVWYLFGGSDFGDSCAEYKLYSGVQGSKCSPKVNQRFYEAKESLFTAGGPQRDHSVCVALHLNKICCLHELFPPDHAQIARQVITVQDAEIQDMLTVSNINKLLYQYATDQKPRQTYVPMVSIKLLHIVPRDAKQETDPSDGECCLKVSILPLRLNVDQDTLQFLQDFGKECGELLENSSSKMANQRRHRVPSNSAPVIKLGTKRNDNIDQTSSQENRPTAIDDRKISSRDIDQFAINDEDTDRKPSISGNIDDGESINRGADWRISIDHNDDRKLSINRNAAPKTTVSVRDLLNEASRDAGPLSIASSSSNETRFYSYTADRSIPPEIDLLAFSRPDTPDEDELCVELFGLPNFDAEIDRVDEDDDGSDFKIPPIPKRSIENRQQPTVSVTFRNSRLDDAAEVGIATKKSTESVRFSKNSTSSSICESADQESMRSSLTRDQSIDDDTATTAAQLNERDMIKLFNTPIRTTDGGLYFKSFTFSPELILRIDYHGKRIQTNQGAVVGLLLGLSHLHCTELRLKELSHRHGLLGFDKVVNHALIEWLRDIRRNQLYSIVGGVGPMHSLVQIALGIRDLFWLPVDQYRRDGHIVKGLQRGAQSFGISTATATLELGQKFFGAVQFMAEFAFDVVNPDYHRQRSQSDILQSLAQPADFREGVTLAMNAFRRGFSETAQAIVLATQEERASGRWAVRGVLRQATPTALRPVVVLSQATSHVLGGLRNQLRPDTRREEQEKWKND